MEYKFNIGQEVIIDCKVHTNCNLHGRRVRISSQIRSEYGIPVDQPKYTISELDSNQDLSTIFEYNLKAIGPSETSVKLEDLIPGDVIRYTETGTNLLAEGKVQSFFKDDKLHLIGGTSGIAITVPSDTEYYIEMLVKADHPVDGPIGTVISYDVPTLTGGRFGTYEYEYGFSESYKDIPPVTHTLTKVTGVQWIGTANNRKDVKTTEEVRAAYSKYKGRTVDN